MLTYKEEWAREPYSKIPPENYLIPHLGQRKLLIAEIDFLNNYGDMSNEVVYAGAGPGYHIAKLADLFPRKIFYLYDPREFAPELAEYKNIYLHQEYFTDEIAAKYKGSGVLFISDIRTAEKSGGDFEEEVIANLEQQARWCNIMKPKMASLKFRMPFKTGEIEYFDGIIRLQAWVGIDSAETRLWTTCKNKKKYIYEEYSEKMFYFNRHLRLGPYRCGQPECMDYCNDCAIEWQVWREYYGKRKFNIDCEEFTIGPHGKLRDLPLKQRIKQLKPETLQFYNLYLKNEDNKIKLNKKIFRN